MQCNAAHERRAYTRYSVSLLAIGFSSISLSYSWLIGLWFIVCILYHLPKLILASKSGGDD